MGLADSRRDDQQSRLYHFPVHGCARQALPQRGVGRKIDEAHLFVGVTAETPGEAGRPFVALRIGLPITPEHLLPNIPATVKWLRFESTPMDLYFDVPRNWHGGEFAGLVVREPDLDDIAELYEVSASRFMFRRWLRRALDVSGMSAKNKIEAQVNA